MNKIPIAFAVYSLFCASSALGAKPEGTSTTLEISFTAQCDGTEQKYVLLLPRAFAAEVPHDVLIALHGHGSDRWQYIRDGRDECRVARDVAAEHDMIFVSPDYRVPTSWMGPKAEADMVQMIAILREKFRVSKVFLCGASMGGSASLTFAALHPDLIDGVAAMNGTANFLEYENFQEAIHESFGGPKTRIPAEYKKRSAEYWPERLTMPVGLTVSGKDEAVPPQSVLRLAQVLKVIGGNVMIIYREEMGHSTQYADGKAILEFMLKAPRPEDDKPSVQRPS